MASEWIEHVKKVAQKKKISYKEAMSVAKASYKPKGGKKAAPKAAPVKEKKPPLKKSKSKKEDMEMEM